MNDFLTRLAQRAVGGASALEPLREPVFPVEFGDGEPSVVPLPATSAVDIRTEDRRAPTPVNPAQKRQSTDRNPSASGLRRETSPPMVDAPQTTGMRRGSDRTPLAPSPSPAARIDAHAPVRPVHGASPADNPHAQPSQDPASPKVIAVPITVAAEPAKGPSARHPGTKTVSSPSPLSPARPPRNPTSEQAASTPPPVTVRIGRIDVRANVAPATAPARTDRKPERIPALGLKEYLERRNGGRR